MRNGYHLRMLLLLPTTALKSALGPIDRVKRGRFERRRFSFARSLPDVVVEFLGIFYGKGAAAVDIVCVVYIYKGCVGVCVCLCVGGGVFQQKHNLLLITNQPHTDSTVYNI